MKFQMYVIRDKQVNSFMTPYFMRNDGEALRSFADEVNRAAEDNILYRHSDDFELYRLGDFDSDSASFVIEKLPVLIVQGASVKK